MSHVTRYCQDPNSNFYLITFSLGNPILHIIRPSLKGHQDYYSCHIAVVLPLVITMNTHNMTYSQQTTWTVVKTTWENVNFGPALYIYFGEEERRGEERRGFNKRSIAKKLE